MQKQKKARTRIGRNETCPCGSGSKYKVCHGKPENSQLRPEIRQYVDQGEYPIKWVIANSVGTSFFADKQNRIMVFSDKQLALEIARLDLFAVQDVNEINIAGVGPTKWAHLQETLPFLEVASKEMAIALIHERIEAQQAEYGIESVPVIPPEDLSNVGSQEEVEQEVSQESGNAGEAVQG